VQNLVQSEIREGHAVDEQEVMAFGCWCISGMVWFFKDFNCDFGYAC
jgi:hypothetical protein